MNFPLSFTLSFIPVNLKDVYLPVACAACKKSAYGCRGASTFDCNNPESNGNLVVRKVSVDVLLPYSIYTLCNVKSNTSCAYECDALGRQQPTGVGNQAVCGGDRCVMAPAPGGHWGGSEKWDYWNYNTAVLMGAAVGGSGSSGSSGVAGSSVAGSSVAGSGNAATGNGQWYSLEQQFENTHWRNATVVKAINAECQRVWLKKVSVRLTRIPRLRPVEGLMLCAV